MGKYSTLILHLSLPRFSSANLASRVLKLFFLLCVYVFTHDVSLLNFLQLKTCSLFIFFFLKSVLLMLRWLYQLLYINLWMVYFPHPFTVYMLYLYSCCKPDITFFFFFKISNLQLDSLCLLTGTLSPLTFNAITWWCLGLPFYNLFSISLSHSPAIF